MDADSPLTLEFSFPIWGLSTTDTSRRHQLTITAEDGIEAVPLFTNEKKAKRFISALATFSKEYKPVILKLASHMILYLEVCETKGANCVVFNPEGEFCDFFTIADMRSRFAHWP